MTYAFSQPLDKLDKAAKTCENICRIFHNRSDPPVFGQNYGKF